MMQVEQTYRRLHGRDELNGIGGAIFTEFGDGRVYADKQLVVTRTVAPEGLRFSGEIDASNVHAVGESLATAFATASDVHVDLTGLMFCDISGIRAFVWAAEGINGTKRLLLHGLPARLQTVMKVVGWEQLASRALCSCEMDQP